MCVHLNLRPNFSYFKCSFLQPLKETLKLNIDEIRLAGETLNFRNVKFETLKISGFQNIRQNKTKTDADVGLKYDRNTINLHLELVPGVMKNSAAATPCVRNPELQEN